MKKSHRFFLSPTRLLAVGFASMILLGALLLMLPLSTHPGHRVGPLDALFTATSAVCVTGLVVVETGAAFTRFGQAVILLLIQFGGLGFMTMATLTLLLLRRRISLKNRLAIQESLNVEEFSGLLRLVLFVVWVSLAIEALGASLLMIRFVPMHGWGTGLWYAVFHAISAYCNAGFDVFGQGSSLSPFAADPLVVLPICGLIVLGGLGFVVLRDVFQHGPRPRRWGLHTKVVLSTTLGLLLIATLLFALLEGSNPRTLGAPGIGPGARALGALLQAVTVRTAGFAGVPQGDLREVSILASVLLMFIGASSASTGGGIKTTTLAVMLALARSVIKGREDVTLFDRRLPLGVVKRAVTIFLIALFTLLLSTLLLAVVEGVLDGAQRPLLHLLFEATSALATVGLSTGLTPSLSPVGKVFVLLLMYMGRVGPLTLTLALAHRQSRAGQNQHLPHGHIMVG